MHYLLKLIAFAIAVTRAFAKVAFIAFDALLLIVFIACHPRELMRAVSIQPVGVQLVIYFQMFVITHAAITYFVSMK